MLPPASANETRGVFILAPIRRKRGELFDLGFHNRLGELKTGELEIVRHQIGIGMGQTFQHHDGGRPSEINHAFT